MSPALADPEAVEEVCENIVDIIPCLGLISRGREAQAYPGVCLTEVCDLVINKLVDPADDDVVGGFLSVLLNKGKGVIPVFLCEL